MAPAVAARSFDDVAEPALVMKLDFGGNARSELGVGLQLNYSTAVRQALGALSASPATSIEALESGIGSRLLETPALAQFDFDRQGFRKASLIGLPLVTRHVRLNQAAGAYSGEAPAEAPAEEGVVQEGAAEEGVAQEGMSEETLAQEPVAQEAAAEAGVEGAVAEDSAWYDYSQWGWKGWGLAAAGTVGAFLLVDGGGGNNSDPAPASSNPPAGTPCTTTVPTPLPPGCTP